MKQGVLPSRPLSTTPTARRHLRARLRESADGMSSPRFRRLDWGDEVKFLTGLDEHGQKVQMSAKKLGVDDRDLRTAWGGEFQGLLPTARRSRTTTTSAPPRTRHKRVVQPSSGKPPRQGPRSKTRPTTTASTAFARNNFRAEKEKVDGKWPEIYGEFVEVTESNIFSSAWPSTRAAFWSTTSRPRRALIYPRFRSADVAPVPQGAANRTSAFSRPKERLSWGVELALRRGDLRDLTSGFDALTQPTSPPAGLRRAMELRRPLAGRPPRDRQRTSFGPAAPRVYWPIMLKALDLPLPRHFLVTAGGSAPARRCPRARARLVDPLDLIDQFGADAFRYFVIREMNVRPRQRNIFFPLRPVT